MLKPPQASFILEDGPMEASPHRNSPIIPVPFLLGIQKFDHLDVGIVFWPTPFPTQFKMLQKQATHFLDYSASFLTITLEQSFECYAPKRIRYV